MPDPWVKPETWHPKLERIYRYWLAIHPADGGLPGRQHVDPAAIHDLLPNVYIVDVSRNPMRFKYRLVGTEYVTHMGRDLTGRYLDEAHTGFQEIVRSYCRTVEERRPDYRNGSAPFQASQRDYKRIERLMVPLARNGSDVDMIFGVIVYIPLEDHVAARAPMSRPRVDLEH